MKVSIIAFAVYGIIDDLGSYKKLREWRNDL